MNPFLYSIVLLFGYGKLPAQDKLISIKNLTHNIEEREARNTYDTHKSLYTEANTFLKNDLSKTIENKNINGPSDSLQIVNPRIKRPWGFSLGYFLSSDGTGAVISYGHFISPQLELGVEIGTLANSFFNYTVAVGGKYHFRKPASTKPLSIFSGLNVIALSNSYSQQMALQIPIGALILNQNGFKYSFSVIPITDFENIETYFEVRVGYNFKKN